MNTIQVSEPALVQFESRLNEIVFRGIPLGGTIAGSLLIELLNGNGRWSLKRRFRFYVDHLNLIYRSNRSVFQTKGIHPERLAELQHKGVLMFSSQRRHIFNMQYPVWKQLEKQSGAVCFLANRKISSLFSDGDQPQMLFANDLPRVDFSSWKNEYHQVKRRVRSVIKEFISANNLPGFVGRRLLNRVIEQTQNIMAFEAFIEQIKPRFILVEHDRHYLSSSLVLTAKASKVLTLSLMHGAVNAKFGYFPMNADFILCWGRRQKDLLDKYADDPDKIVVAGAPQLSRSVEKDGSAIRDRLGIKPDQKVVLLATNNIPLHQRIELASIFCDAVNKHENLFGVVRLHPSEHLESYQEVIDRNQNILFDKNQSLTFDDSMSVADLVCVYNSAFGLDAMFNSLPLIVINIDTESLGQGLDFIEYGKLPEVTNTNELVDLFGRFLNNTAFATELKNKSVDYANAYCALFSHEAAEKIVDIIDKKVNKPELIQ